MTITVATYALSILIAVIAGVVGTILIYKFFERINIRLDLLEKESDRRHLALIEASKRGRKHHAYETAEGLEDAMAVMIDVLLNQEAETARVQTALGILQQVRQGPKAYQPKNGGEK
jgi:hypothetical protein